MLTIRRLLVAAIVVLAAVACGRAQNNIAPGYLGLMLDDRPWDIDGVPVMRVHPRTPAALAGFQVGDIVVTCNGSRIRDVGDFARAIYQVPVGGTAVIEVQRGGNLFELTATLSDVPNTPLENFRPPVAPEISTNRLRDGRPMLGLVVGVMQTRSYGTFGSLRQWGVVVEDIVPDSPAEQYRVPRGAILTSINGLSIRSPDDVFAIMEEVDPARPVELTYVLGGSAYRQLIPLSAGDTIEPRGVAKPPEEGIVIEPPPEPAPPAADDTLPELPPPDRPSADDVRAMRSELETLRRRAAEIQAELDAIKRDAAKPK
jgi:S1-C subfamily serine protease